MSNVLLSSWLGREIAPPTPNDPPAPNGSDLVREALVRRCLTAFGPAATADLRAWSGLAGLPAAVAEQGRAPAFISDGDSHRVQIAASEC